MRHRHARNDAGFTFAELAFALLILVIGAVVLINHLAVNYQTTNTERDRVWAYAKAQAILAEIQGYVDRGQVDAAVDLDVLDDGIVSKGVMSIQEDANGALVAADHPVSGNYQRDGDWHWWRRITVQPFLGLNNRNVRYVTVRIYKKDRAGIEHPMADLSAVINSAGSAFPTTQVFDVYLLAVENIPGWWVFMDSIKPFVESMITDLENRNPGLIFRTHWITKASFGRNQTYRPYTNDDTDSHAVIPDVYHYPGRMPSGNASTYYYVPDNMRGRINCDGVERNGYDADLNPHPYALADYFNHAMRYPEELALWQRRVQAIEARELAIAEAKRNGTAIPADLNDMSKEPTMRLFLEDLVTSPDKYKNALIINLHGELLPMPALRNFSDPAKSPSLYPNLRVVTHPEELRTRRNQAGVTDSVQLRMYAFSQHTATYTGPTIMPEPMVVEILGVNLTDSSNPSKLASTCNLSNVPGGVSVGGSTNYPTAWQVAKHSSDSPVTNEMHYTAEFVPATGTEEALTRVYLFNTPVGAPPVTQGALQYGLANSTRARLYAMDYIPCPIGAGPSFAPDLTSSGVGPKNTARWTLRIAPEVLTNDSFVGGNPPGDVLLRIRTRIAAGYSGGDEAWKSSGSTWPLNDPDNLSMTYTWWADSREDVPATERAQFNGDPRHLPYLDCFNNGDDFPNSYNWYLDNLNNTNNAALDFPAISSALLRNRWGVGQMACDVPRYFDVLRRAIVNSAVVFTTLTGYSYFYLGIGNDIGYDAANGYANSIPSNQVPHGTSGNGFINTITGARRYVRANGSGSGYWWGIPWLGELYPDDASTTWSDGTTPRGNLGAGNTAGNFYQQPCQTVYSGSSRLAYGTTMSNNIQRTSTYGCTTLFNIGTAASTFNHIFSSGNGTLTTVGSELATNYSMSMPGAVPVNRPFRVNTTATLAEHWNYPPYTTGRHTASIYRTYYTHSAGTGSGLVKLVNETNTSAGYIVVNGISAAVDNGTSFIAKFAVLSLAHSFFEAGSTTNTLRIPQLPRLEIDSPTDITELNDPATIDIQYSTTWQRWDGLEYAQSGTFSESELLLHYVIMYSLDNGTTWLHVQDGTEATPGTRPTDSAHLVTDAAVGGETYSWPVPAAQFPEGSYLLRIDCYRQGAQVHYACHQTKIFIQR